MTTNSQLVEKLRSLITEGDEVDRCYAIRTIQTIQDTSSTEMLIEAIRDDDIDVSVDAITALGELGGESVTEKLIDSLVNDPDDEIKVACVRALAVLGDSKAATELLKLAEKPPEETSFATGDWDLWWDMQLAAIRGLGKMQLADAIPVLKRILEEDDCLDIESEIFNSLAQIGSNNADANEYLFERMSKGNTRTRRRIVKALGKSNTTSTMKPLARALQDIDADVREATLLALQERGANQYLPAILLTFRDANSTVRKTAIEVAQQLSQQLQGSEASANSAHLIEKLLPLLKDPDSKVKSAALNTLSNLNWQANDEEKEYLSDLLRESSGDCFAAVCRAIDEQQLSDGIATLLYMFRHKELTTSENEIHALTTIGRSKQWNSIIESTLGANIFNDEKMVRLAALEALSELDKSFPQGADYDIDKTDEDARLPMDMITEALQGQLKPPSTHKVIPIVPIDDVEKKFAAADTEDKESTEQADSNAETAFVDNALEEISQSIADGEKPHPMSTLDAIAITSVEKGLEAKTKQATEEPITLEKLAEDDEELKAFVALTKENKETTKWLFNKEPVDVSIDIQRLAARMLGNAGYENAMPVLLKAFESNDSELKREAALSIGILVEKGLRIDEDSKLTLHKALLQELAAEERDLRIASARALGALGDAADIPYLIPKLQDSSIAMRMQTLRSLSQIAMQSEINRDEYHELAEHMLAQLETNEVGIHRAVVDALLPLFGNKLNGSALSLKEKAISSLINAGLSGANGQVKEMSWGLNALDKELSRTRLLEKMDDVTNSVDRRYVVEMLGELYRPV